LGAEGALTLLVWIQLVLSLEEEGKQIDIGYVNIWIEGINRHGHGM
jgi:hypothetical protein